MSTTSKKSEAEKRAEIGVKYDNSLTSSQVKALMDYVPDGLKAAMSFMPYMGKVVDPQFGIKPRFRKDRIMNMSPADKVAAFDYIMNIILEDKVTPKNAKTSMVGRLGWFIARDANDKVLVGEKPVKTEVKSEEDKWID